MIYFIIVAGYLAAGFFFSIVFQVINGAPYNMGDIGSSIIFWPYGIVIYIMSPASRWIYSAIFGRKSQ